MKVRKLGDNRDRLLHQSRLKIVGFLNDLPKTKHFMDSFTLDVTLATAHLMSFTVTGLFRERAVPEQGSQKQDHTFRYLLSCVMSSHPKITTRSFK